MTLQNPTYIQDICYTARDDRLQMAGMISAEGVATFDHFRVTQQPVASKYIDISLGHAYVNNDQDTSAGEGGYYHVYNDNTISVLIADNNSGSTRTDYVWLKITDTAYVAGTSGASIVVNQTSSPSDGSTYYRLATISVPNAFTSIQGYPLTFGSTDSQIMDEREGFVLFGSGGGGLIGRQVFTTSGTFAIADFPGARAIDVTVVGGGGGGGGSIGTDGTHVASGGGGGGGGGAKKFVLASALSASETVTVGAAGAGGTGSGNGTAGGTSSFGTFASASGGSGGGGDAGPNASGNTGPGAASVGGGVGTIGDVIARGQSGDKGYMFAGRGDYGGFGGVSAFGFGTGGFKGSSASQNGSNASGYGGGGSGASSGTSSAARTGGNGAPGIVIVDVYA